MSAKGMLSSIGIRAVSGALFVLLVMGGIYLGHLTFALLVALVMLIALFEFYRIVQKLSASPQWVIGFAGAIVVFFACYAKAFHLFTCQIESLLLYAAIPVITLSFAAELYRRSGQVFANIAYTLLGLLYVALPFSLMPFVYAKGGAPVMYCFFLLLWANDTFAFLCGLGFGKHKLFPRHSPKKTWEGYAGGILSVWMVAYLLHLYFSDLAYIHILIMGLIIAGTAVLGDLVESMLKRSANVKDSGKIMPGHGGMLDRFDAALLAFPLVFVYIQLFL